MIILKSLQQQLELSLQQYCLIDKIRILSVNGYFNPDFYRLADDCNLTPDKVKLFILAFAGQGILDINRYGQVKVSDYFIELYDKHFFTNKK